MALLILELLLVIICLHGMLSKQQTWSFDRNNLQTAGGSFTEDGTFTIDESSGVAGATVLSTQPLTLHRGVYRVRLSFAAQQEQLSQVTDDHLGYHALLANPVTLRVESKQRDTSYRFFLLQNTDDLKVTVYYTGQGKLTVSGMTLTQTNQEYSMLLLVLLLVMVPADYLLLRVSCGKKLLRTDRQVIYGMFVISLLASLPILLDYMHLGDDVYFHMNRIEGLVREWEAGHFPARMQSYWVYGLGYPVSIMYGDVLLWITALFRFCGFDLAVSFKAGLILWNILTAWICYVSFRGMFRSREIGLFGSAVYTLSLYRMYNIYVRLAIGEYTAMTFLPLACYGFSQILSADRAVVRQKKNSFLLAIAYLGMLFSHILTLELSVVFGILVCLLYFRRLLRLETLQALGKSILLALGAGLWFLVPFLDYMARADMQVFHVERPIQKFGLYITQLFWIFPWMGNHPSMWESGMQDVRPFGIGLGLLTGTAVFLYLFFVRRRQLQGSRFLREGAVAAGIAILSGVMCLHLFPWDALSSLSDGMKRLIYSIQFPYRLLLIVTAAMTVTGCCAAMLLQGKENLRRLFMATVLATTMLSGMFFTNSETQTRVWSDLREAACMGADVLGGKEYLLQGTDMNKLNYTSVTPGKDVTCSTYEKKYSTVQLTCSNNAQTTGTLEITLLNYPGYHAWITDTGEPVRITNGAENRIRLLIPPGFSGQITVDFNGELSWKAADLVSLLTILLSLVYGLGIWNKTRMCRKTAQK